jgi:hypothetical protein
MLNIILRYSYTENNPIFANIILCIYLSNWIQMFGIIKKEPKKIGNSREEVTSSKHELVLYVLSMQQLHYACGEGAAWSVIGRGVEGREWPWTGTANKGKVKSVL